MNERDIEDLKRIVNKIVSSSNVKWISIGYDVDDESCFLDTSHSKRVMIYQGKEMPDPEYFTTWLEE